MNAAAVAFIVVRVVDMAMAIGTALWLEAAPNFSHAAAEALDHRPQHMIGQHQQVVILHLQRHMPVADVISDARKLRDVCGTHLVQAFVRCDDFDNAAIIQRELVAM